VATHHNIGKLTEAVETLKTEVSSLRSKVDRVTHILYACGVVLAIGLWLLNKIADSVLSNLAK
jgi:hypothetical protein